MIQLPSIGLAMAALLAAALVALIFTPMVRALAFRVGAVDVPKDTRRMHDHPIPRMAGWPFSSALCSASSCFCPSPPSCGVCCWAV